MAVLAVAAMATCLAQAGWSKHHPAHPSDQHAGTPVEGVLAQVHAAYIVLRTDEGKEITLQTQEDLRLKVGAGTRVKAWYLPASDGYALGWLDYPRDNLFAPRDEIHSHVKTVAILPVTDLPDANGFLEAVAAYLRSNLHWSVPPPAGSGTLDAINPATGQVDIAHYMQKSGTTVATLMASAHAEAVLEIDIQAVPATVRNRVATWDGVEEPLAGGPKVGEAPATTVTLKLWGEGGKLLWTNHRGFAVLVASSGGKLRDRSLAEVLLNTSGVQDWLNVTFAGLVSGPKN